MKKLLTALCTLLLLMASSCVGSNVNNAITPNITDDMGNTAYVTKASRIVSCYGSFAECWLLSGGELVGVTQDAIEERELTFDSDVSVLGTVKEINIEALIATKPDYIILSADLTAHLALKDSLDSVGLSYGYFSVDTFDDYKCLMQRFCQITGRDDLFKENVTDVERRINDILNRIPDECDDTVLLMRAFSSGIKAKTDDNIAGQILNEFGLENIADKNPSLLEDISTEYVIKEDPDYIFLSTMGSEQAALNYINDNVENNPAWAELSAIENDRYILLPKDLFHYKPNNRWDKSYEYLAKIIFPEIFE